MDSNSLRQIFSANLKKFRKIKGLTQNELARLTELSPQTIIRIEGAKLWPSDKTLCKLAEVLKVDFYKFFLANDNISMYDERSDELKSYFENYVKAILKNSYDEFVKEHNIS